MNIKKFLFVPSVLLIITLVLNFMPRHVVKEGYIFKTVESIEYTDDVTKTAYDTYLPASGHKSISIYFDQRFNYLSDLLKSPATLKVTFEGKYHPVFFHKYKYGWKKFSPAIVIDIFISTEKMTK